MATRMMVPVTQVRTQSGLRTSGVRTSSSRAVANAVARRNMLLAPAMANMMSRTTSKPATKRRVVKRLAMRVGVDAGANPTMEPVVTTTVSDEPIAVEAPIELPPDGAGIVDTGVEDGVEVTGDSVSIAPQEIIDETGGFPWKLVLGLGVAGFAWYKWKKSKKG